MLNFFEIINPNLDNDIYIKNIVSDVINTYLPYRHLLNIRWMSEEFWRKLKDEIITGNIQNFSYLRNISSVFIYSCRLYLVKK